MRSTLRWAGNAVLGRPWLPAVIVVGLGGLLVWRLAAADSGPQLPESTFMLEEACEKPGTTYPDAAPYGGQPPHPAAVFPEEFYDYESQEWMPDDPRDVQLIACVVRVTEGVPSRSGYHDCGYFSVGGGPGRTVPLVDATYRISVYELRTGREITVEHLSGEHDVCPERLYGDADAVYTLISLDQLHAVLDPYVERRRS